MSVADSMVKTTKVKKNVFMASPPGTIIPKRKINASPPYSAWYSELFDSTILFFTNSHSTLTATKLGCKLNRHLQNDIIAEFVLLPLESWKGEHP